MESNSKPYQELANSPPPPHHPPLHPPTTDKRARRRAREVSSRYMTTPSASSPSISSFSGDPHLASPKYPTLPLPKNHHHHHQIPRRKPSGSVPSSPDATDSESEPSSRYADENQPGTAITRSSETPLQLGIQSKADGTQRKRVVRLFNDNGGEEPLDLKFHSRRLRPGTPMVSSIDRTSTNSTPRSTVLSQKFMRSMKRTAAQVKKSEEDSRNGLMETSMENSTNIPDFSEAETCSISSQGGFCDSPPLLAPSSCRVRPVSEIRSSMPEADQLPTMSARGRMDAIDDSSYRASSSSSLCHRSLNFSLLNYQQHHFNSTKSINKPPISLKLYSSSAKSAALCLPPQPPNTKMGTDSRNGRKGSNRQEDVYSLRLLDNRYLQWRFVNAKAEVALDARRIAAEKSLYGLSAKISELQSSFTMKRIELEQLKRIRSLSNILEAQMPYLEEWRIHETDYSSSLSGTINSLQDASLRLPFVGNVKADVKEMREVLESATNMLEALSPHLGNFQPKAEGMDDIISNLATVVIKERDLIEECGDILSEAHKLQVVECSLRSQLLQLKRSSVK